MEKKEDRFPYTCYLLNGILFVPDYEILAWVGPGSNNIYSEEMLIKLKAKPKIEILWKRLEHKHL